MISITGRHGIGKTKYLTRAALIAALYVLLTWLSSLFPANVASVVRLSEMLCVLVLLTSAAVPGMAIGCLLANLLVGGNPIDIIGGALVTLLATYLGYLLRRLPLLVPAPTVILNAVIIPWILRVAYQAETGYGILLLTVFVSEFVSAYLLGMLLFGTLKKSTGLDRVWRS